MPIDATDPVTLLETPDFVVRFVPREHPRSTVAGMMVCWVTRWTSEAEAAIAEHGANAVSTPSDGPEATAMLRDLARFAEQITCLKVGKPKAPFDLSPANELINLAYRLILSRCLVR